METKLYVGNLAYSATEDELRRLFTQAGAVQSVNVIKDRDTGRSKGFAFVEMSTQAEAEKAISLFNGASFHDRALTVNLARPREARGGFRKRGGDRSGGGSRGGGRQRGSW
jgi:RNA recognition motif-containing protein